MDQCKVVQPSQLLSLSVIVVRSLVKLFLVTQACFPGNERTLPWIFSKKVEKQRRTINI